MTPDKDKIKRLRKAKGWNQEVLSEKAGISKRIVQKAEAGESLSQYSLEQLAYVLNVEMKELCSPVMVQNPITLAFHLEDDLPEDVAHCFTLLQKALTDYKIYKANKLPPVNIYFIPGTNKYGETTFLYALAAKARHDEFVKIVMETGDVPNFSVVVEVGTGEPSAAIKAKMLQYYGFDHDAMKAKQ